MFVSSHVCVLSCLCLIFLAIHTLALWQTHAVLRQAWIERLRPVLVLNKIDRCVVVFLRLCMSSGSVDM